MADEIKNEAQETTDIDVNAKLEEAEARAKKAEEEAKRFKASIDKLTKEAAERKRAEREKMTEEERAANERNEEYQRLKEQAEKDAAELNHLKAVTAYKDISEDSVIEKLIDAVDDKDHAAIAGIIKNECEKAVKAKEAEWKKSRPASYVGDGSRPSLTKEEILAITDPEERIRQIALHKELF